jgi:HAD superfamily hydrolase (TIGR01450 family)
VTVADDFDVFLVDLDGVVYLGGEPLPGAVESLNRLDRMGKTIRYLTNDPRPRRATIARRLRDLGVRVDTGEIVTSAWAAARYLDHAGIRKVSVVGSEGLSAELRARGLRLTEDGPEAVVVGADERTTYRDLQRATRHIDRGATFVGTNPDGSFPTPDGPAPGAGAIVRAVETVTGVEPIIVGKPEPLMFEMALEDVPDGARAVVIGDNPDTDVLGAHRAGLTAILVADDEPEHRATTDLGRPDGRISGLADVFDTSIDAFGVTFDVADPTSDDARYCIDAYFDELDGRFDVGFDPSRSISADADELTGPDGLLLLARLHGDPVGCGALKLHDDAPAEIKRMWVDPSARGLGLGRRLLAELEEQARARGVRKVRLETNRTLTEAIRLYRSAGYEEVEPFNEEPYAHHWFEKRLDPVPDEPS